MDDERSLFLVDDDEDDRYLFQEALRSVNAAIECRLAYNGEHALRQMLHPDFVLPALMFVDMNMPRVSGKELLQEIRQIPTFHPVPIIMYSTAGAPAEMKEVVILGAAEFLVKESSFDRLCGQIKEVLLRYDVV